MSSDSNFNREHYVQLVSDLTDGVLAPDQLEELRRVLATDEVAARWYCNWISIHSQLQMEFGQGEFEISLPRLAAAAHDKISPSNRVSGFQQYRLSITAIVSLLAASLVWFTFYHPVQPQQQAAEHRTQSSDAQIDRKPNSAAARREFEKLGERPLAIVTHLAIAAGSNSQLVQGTALGPGRFAIESGAAQLEFVSGAILVVQGPADIELLSSERIFCRLGKLRARVPTQAHGFTIETPTHRAIDLGTEFAVDVSATDHSTEVHVLDGLVELKGREGSTSTFDRKLKLGDGFRALASGQVSDIKAVPNQFIGAERLLLLSARENASHYEAWRRHDRELVADKDVITYFNFEDHTPWQRFLRQDGPHLAEASDGAIVGCRWSEGRWPEKSALEFKGTENCVRIFVPGDYESITLASWIRIDGFDRYFSAIMLTDGHELGQVHWQFTEAGQLLLGVKAEVNKSQDYLSGVVLRPTDVGRWVHLACVYDHESGAVIHYVDGRRVSTEAIHKETLLRFGDAELGNWFPKTHKSYRVRSFNGRMDQFIIFKTALSEQQVHKMYEAEKPNS